MYLILFRHGPAGDRIEYAKTHADDSKRELTDDGQKVTRKAAKGLAKLIKGDCEIYSSPYVRTKQTAEILKSKLKAAGDIVYTDSLTHERDPEDFAQILSSLKSEFVVAVGHEPHLSSLASFLVYGDKTPYKLKLKKSGALAIRFGTDITDRDQVEFLWLMTPAQLKK